MIKFYKMFETKESPPEEAEELKETAEEIKQERTKSPIETPEEQVLENREQEYSSSLGGGENETIFTRLKDNGSGIFKPRRGEREVRTEAKPGTYFKRERAAYLVDRFLGFGLVPPTVIRTIKGAEGSLQQFIPDAKTIDETPKQQVQSEPIQEELKKLWIFDYITYNSDRHLSNLLIKDNKVHAIDNGLTFAADKLRRIYGVREFGHADFLDSSFPDDAKEKLEAFSADKNTQKILKDLLLELLSPKEVSACLSRIEKVRQFAKKGPMPQKDQEELTFK